MKWKLLFCTTSRKKLGLASILTTLLAARLQHASGDGDHPWCYEDEKCSPAHWAGVCKTGHSQSPIDFQLDKVIHARQLRNIKVNKQYREVQPRFYIKNNGHTIQVQLDEEMTSSLKIVSDGLRGPYQFSQMHFHWGADDQSGSEHTVSGTSYAMEAHLVHFSDKYENILAAISDQNTRALAVFGVFFTASKRDNPALNPITDAIEQIASYHPDPLEIDTPGLNMSAFFPDILDLFRYDGSLTTPSCGEKVVWTVFRQPVAISHRQLAIFRSSQDTSGKPLVNNFRPTQPVSRRKVMEAVATLSEIQGDVDNADNVDNAGSDDDGTGSDKDNTPKKISHGNTHEHDDDDDDDVKKSSAESVFRLSFVLVLSCVCIVRLTGFTFQGYKL